MMDDESFYLSQIPTPTPSYFRPKKISNLMTRVLTKYGVASQQTSELMESAWRDLVGPDLARATKVGGIKRGSLFIAVESELVAQEIHMRQQEIVRTLTNKLSLSVNKIRKLTLRVDSSLSRRAD